MSHAAFCRDAALGSKNPSSFFLSLDKCKFIEAPSAKFGQNGVVLTRDNSCSCPAEFRSPLTWRPSPAPSLCERHLCGTAQSRALLRREAKRQSLRKASFDHSHAFSECRRKEVQCKPQQEVQHDPDCHCNVRHALKPV